MLKSLMLPLGYKKILDDHKAHIYTYTFDKDDYACVKEAYSYIKDDLDIGDILLSLYQNQSFVAQEKEAGLVNSLLSFHTGNASLVSACLATDIFNIADIEPFFAHCHLKKHFIYHEIVLYLEGNGWDYFTYYFDIKKEYVISNPTSPIVIGIAEQCISSFLSHAMNSAPKDMVEMKVICRDFFESIKRLPKETLLCYFEKRIRDEDAKVISSSEVDLLLLSNVVSPLDLMTVANKSNTFTCKDLKDYLISTLK